MCVKIKTGKLVKGGAKSIVVIWASGNGECGKGYAERETERESRNNDSK